MTKLIRSTLAEQAYQELRSRILSGRLPGGTRLLPNELAADLGISATPIKEACAKLEADGLIVSSARRGMVVRQLTAADVTELYNARILLEKGALERAIAMGAITQDLLAGLADSLERHGLYARGGTLDDLSSALSHDRDFHRLLVAAAGIGMVSEWHGRIVGQTHTVFVSIPGNYERSVHEHQEILEALQGRAKKTAIAALERHLTRSLENTLLQVRELEFTMATAGS
jgi:DNA-binding GntR family transcriptional regulator